MTKPKTAIDADPARSSVGYGKPPTRTRFKKGRSGNRKGRPTGRKNYCVILEHVLKEGVRLPDNRLVSKAEALVLRAQHGALKGDPGAIKVLDLFAEKLELSKPCENAEGRKYGYLVVPRKLPREEWVKVAQRALKHNLEPESDPRFKRPGEPIKITRKANRGDP
jgi:Family of unknown function (DUF5681)